MLCKHRAPILYFFQKMTIETGADPGEIQPLQTKYCDGKKILKS